MILQNFFTVWDNREELSLIAKTFDVILEQLNIIETKREEY